MSWGFTLSPFGTVREIIESWRPKGCTTEKKYEQSLLRKLQKELKEQKIQIQYGSGRQRVDIVVNGKVPIELKKDLKTTSALQRTIGQIDQYLQDWNRLFLVFCGNVAPDLLKNLKKYAKNIETEDWDKEIFIIVKKQNAK